MEFKSSVIENIAFHAKESPDKLCLADIQKDMTYGQVWNATSCLANALSRQGVSKGDYVVIESNQSVDFMLYLFAVQLLHAVPVPVELNAAASRICELVSETSAVLYVGHRPISDLGDTAYLNIGDAVGPTAPLPADDVIFPSSEEVAEVLFSTGTTGKSKGVVLTHRNDIAIAENVCYGVEQKPNNVEMIPMPTSHSHGLRRTYANMCNGSSVVFVEGVMYLKKVFKLMDQYGVTSMDLSPSMLSIIFRLSGDRLGDYADVLDYIQLGSAPLAEEDKQHLSRLLPNTRLYNFYGSTEAGCSCLLDFNKMSGKPGCIGRPAHNATFIVVDDDKNIIESSPDHLGFLASAGAINMREYFHAPELTASAMQDGYIYTKDVGYIDEDGLVYMLGRKDDVINYGGIKISPDEIEAIVIKYPAIEDCALIPMEDPLTGQAPKLFIQLKEPDYDAKAFKSWLAEHVDQNKQPVRIEVIDKIPRTFNGKIIRQNLK